MKNRIDREIVRRNIVKSRAKAKELIENKCVECNGKVVKKVSFLISDEDEIKILDNNLLKYVSRGGLKLEKAINVFNIDFKNKVVMDIGSSTGGFTDCAIKHGAKKVVAVDVGTNVMDEELKKNPKIDLHEQTNIKKLDSKYFKNIDIIVTDVSFISIKKIIDKIYEENIKVDLICLIKPQFECGKEVADKYKGIILDKNVHLNILDDIIGYFKNKGYILNNLDYSPIKGGDGNIEYISYFTNKNTNDDNIVVRNVVEKAFYENN